MAIVVLRILECIKTSETTEEPCLHIFNGTDLITPLGPYSMKRGDTQNLENWNLRSDDIRICLIEHDVITKDDHYGGVRIETIDDEDCADCIGNGRYIVNLPSNEDIRYKLHLDIFSDYDERTPPQIDNYCLSFSSLRCDNAQQREDNVFLKVNGATVWGPHSMRTGNTETESLVSVGSILIPAKASIQLWEEDRSRNDFFGELLIEISKHYITDSLLRDNMEDAYVYDPPLNTEMPHEFKRDRGIVGDMRYTLRYRIVRTNPETGFCDE
jgi:hypothetical protein